MTLLTRITTNPEQCGGRPCIRGMRIRVTDVLELFDRVPVHCAVRIDEAPCPDWAVAQLS